MGWNTCLWILKVVISFFFFCVLCSLSLLQRSAVGCCGGVAPVSFGADSDSELQRGSRGSQGVWIHSYREGEEKEEPR